MLCVVFLCYSQRSYAPWFLLHSLIISGHLQNQKFQKQLFNRQIVSRYFFDFLVGTHLVFCHIQTFNFFFFRYPNANTYFQHK